ncbi:MAG: ATP-binding cassette domain-containing protein, partial [Pseudomonadota bacterium]
MSPHADQSGLSPAPAAVAEGQGGAADATASATGEALTQARAALDEGCRLALVDVAKDFVMHLRGGQRISVVEAVTFSARPSACVVLAGPSGAGKSSILKMIYANYRCARGVILVRDAV